MNEMTYILVLAVVVTIHEFGHYTMARTMGVKVKRLQLFFYSLYSFKPKAAKSKRGKTSWRDTEYAIGWLPFGGYTSYVKRPTSVTLTDAYGQKHSMDYDTYLRMRGIQPGNGNDDTYYNTKPAWKRLMISLAGVLFNIITAFVIYMLVIMLSDIDGTVGFWHELSAALDFIGYAVGTTFANIFAMVGMNFFHPTISPENYDVIAAFAETASTFPFIIRIADLSCVLALINILPIPPLDGGHAVFEIYEMITGNPPSPAFQKGASVVGSIIFIIIFWILPMLA